MIKNIYIDLKSVKDKSELLKSVSDQAIGIQKVNGEAPSNWDALSDNLSCFHIEELEESDEKKINLIFRNWSIFTDFFPKEDLQDFLSILIFNTDPSNRVDGYNFTFQVRSED